ncbi:uncharacterized protein LOC120282866 [Dioscorea cayenensis subsp. rotundata]|uniref:Uncharacterized protein LOC120282866 n=1 Tax=Dioscorea cayennensis subsp. rotundata TaxID=55577 RepID=A0AB40D3G6_DIOCR|nr:uncharacterized protein LOC120282866 [Dioscorea cayenensis subsp. rotundata]
MLFFSWGDKIGGPPNLSDIRDASSFIHDLKLFEPPSRGRRFTWSNGQVNPTWVKLDRFIVNGAWAEMFPRLIQNCLPRLGSDHVPIRLEVGMHCYNPRPFRFELTWTTVDGFASLVSQWWASCNPQGCGAFVIAKKLQVLRDKLRVWSKESFGSIKLRKLDLLQELEILDIIKESEPPYLGESAEEVGLWERLEVIRKQEEFQRQKKTINFIPSVKIGEEFFSEVREIGKVFENRFRALFGQQRPFRFKVDLNRLLTNKARVDLSQLERPFTIEEVKKAVFDLGSDKAPGPDGFPLLFFKSYWETVKVEVLKMCEDFYDGRANLERINWASIVLIPKISSPVSPGDYRPISLINSSLKIISKILASRLSTVMASLVDHSQSAFLKGRCILDNIATAEELLFSIHKRKMDDHVLKVDFAKAFDSVDWEFLLELLKARGFGTKWIGWICNLLSMSKASILINGSPRGYVRYQRGLRQGDPLSPLLFVLVTDVLSTLFENALFSQILVGVPVGEVGSIWLSGLETNFAKTCLFSSDPHQLPDERTANTFCCSVSRLPVTYLGIPISGRRPRNHDWRSLIDKIKSRLSTWKSNYLSIGGRLTLLNSVLSSLPTFWMSMFCLPKWVIKEIDRIRRDFLWSGPDMDIPRCRLVAWQAICRSKEQGGWGILNLSVFNMALLGKWRWKFLSDSNWCCARVIKFNYNLTSWNMFSLPRGRVSFFWSGVLKGLSAFNGCVTVKVHFGMEALFWKDRWLNGRAPMHLWPNEFLASPMQNASVFDLRHLLVQQPFSDEHTDSEMLLVNWISPAGLDKDVRFWSLNANGSFSVKSFYDRLNDGGLRCPIAKFFWKGPCPRKVNIFNWLAWKDKILTLENLAKRRCNKLPTDTCVLCHEAVESVDHLFLQCRFSLEVWAQLSKVVQLPALPRLMSVLWGVWRATLPGAVRVMGDGVFKAFVWAIWLARNDVIFADKSPDGLRSTLDDSISSIRRSLDFTGPQSEGAVVPQSTGEALDDVVRLVEFLRQSPELIAGLEGSWVARARRSSRKGLIIRRVKGDRFVLAVDYEAARNFFIEVIKVIIPFPDCLFFFDYEVKGGELLI